MTTAILALAMSLPTPAFPTDDDDDLVERILRSDGRLARIVSQAEDYRLQVVIGVVEEGDDGAPTLVQHAFRAGEEYFYPASAIKLTAAIAALEHLHELRDDTGLPISATTPLVFHPQFEGETLIERDATNLDGGVVTVAHEIRKLFLVSDNEAFNRLYELVGPAALNASMHRAGLPSARILHRLSEARTPEENRQLPRIELIGDGFRHERPARLDDFEPPPLETSSLAIGRAHLAGGERVDAPFDFAAKNAMLLVDLQRALCMVTRSDVDCGGPGFRLDDADRRLLREAMSQYPGQSTNPLYDAAEYPDHWVKFLLPGLERVIPKARLRIENKIGRAYGFSVENAHVTDIETGRGFFLAAVLYTNANNVLNDDVYEYETVADPFLADLGEVVARCLWTRP